MLVISEATALRFYKPNDLMNNPNNSRYNDVATGYDRFGFVQKFLRDDIIPFQFRTDAAEPTAILRREGGNDYSLNIVRQWAEDPELCYVEVPMTQTATFVRNKVIITAGSEQLISEYFAQFPEQILPLKIGFTGYGITFDFDYNKTDVVHILRFETAAMRIKPAKSKQDVYRSGGTIVKLKEELFRQYEIIIDAIPDWVIEKIQIAMAHDIVTINDVEVVLEGDIQIKNDDGMLKSISFVVSERQRIGINTLTGGEGNLDYTATE